MSRMLQALKNLEARSERPAAQDAAPSPATPPKPASPPKLTQPPTAFVPAAPTVEPPPSAPAAPAPAPTLFSLPVTAPSSAAAVTVTPPAAPLAAKTPPPKRETLLHSRSATRQPTGIERAVRRTLAEPHRRQPLAELAARLRRDAHQTGSRTLLLAGIGRESTTHETALYVAALLAEEGGNILLVDADLARRQLSTDLDDLQEPGFSDLTREGTDPATLVQPTAFEGLAFLPAGSQRFADLENTSDRLARGLGQLAAGYDLAILDGGRAGDQAGATLARLSDATYVVVQLGAVEAAEAQQALRDLRAAGARVLGCIATS